MNLDILAVQEVEDIGILKSFNKDYLGNDKYPPDNHFWTHRFSPQSGGYHYNLYYQIWISPTLSGKLNGAWVGRRKSVGGDGSDHDPVWIELEI